MLSETCFEIDFNLSDVLSNIDDCASVTSRKNRESNGNLNSYNLSFSIDNIPNYNLTSDIKNDDLDDDLNALLDSCHVHSCQPSGLISLAALANNHLSNNCSATSGSKLENCLSSSFAANLKNDGSDEIKLLDCLEDILLEGESGDHDKICTEDFMSTPGWEHSSSEDSRINERNHKPNSNKETVDDELIPEINLNFCIKKNSKDTFSTVSSSPESSDSGFYEIDSSSEKCMSNSSDEASSWESTFSTNPRKSPLFSSKQSILSRAICAKPKTDKSRKAKLQNIRSELLKKSIPQAVSKCKQEQNLLKFKAIIDHSDQCVITSSFLEILGQ